MLFMDAFWNVIISLQKNESIFGMKGDKKK